MSVQKWKLNESMQTFKKVQLNVTSINSTTNVLITATVTSIW